MITPFPDQTCAAAASNTICAKRIRISITIKYDFDVAIGTAAIVTIVTSCASRKCARAFASCASASTNFPSGPINVADWKNMSAAQSRVS